MGLELLAAGVGQLHDAVADDSRNDAAYGGESKEERFRFAGPSHDPFPHHRHLVALTLLSLRLLDLISPSHASFGFFFFPFFFHIENFRVSRSVQIQSNLIKIVKSIQFKLKID